MSLARTTRDEMETTITFNRHVGLADCCTADPAIARRWRKRGWPVEVLGRYPNEHPRTWQATVPWRVAVVIKTHRQIREPPRSGGHRSSSAGQAAQGPSGGPGAGR